MDLASTSERRLRHSVKPHHRHQKRSAAAAAVGAAGSFTHGYRVNTASAHAIINRGTMQPASDTTRSLSNTHTHM